MSPKILSLLAVLVMFVPTQVCAAPDAAVPAIATSSASPTSAPPSETKKKPPVASKKKKKTGGKKKKPPVEKKNAASAMKSALAAVKATAPVEVATVTPDEESPLGVMRGKFITRFNEPKTPEYGDLYNFLSKEDHFLDDFVADLNKFIKLPKSIAILIDECGDANAFFEPVNNTITLCYEQLDEFVGQADEMELNEDETTSFVKGATLFIVGHELGHALIRVLELPITGKEEDVADQFSAYYLLDMAPNSKNFEQYSELATYAAMWFDQSSQDAKATYQAGNFADEHSLNEQRYFNLMCWIYGADPAVSDDIITSGGLPRERADQCSDEYQQISKTWAKLLKPYNSKVSTAIAAAKVEKNADATRLKRKTVTPTAK